MSIAARLNALLLGCCGFAMLVACSAPTSGTAEQIPDVSADTDNQVEESVGQTVEAISVSQTAAGQAPEKVASADRLARPPDVSNNTVGGVCEGGLRGEFDFNSDYLLRVLAVDANVGNRDGDGIDRVEMAIVNPSSGALLLGQIEHRAAYCIFGGDSPCNPWPQRDGRLTWTENGPVVESGIYQLRVRAIAKAIDPHTNQPYECNWSVQVSIDFP